MELWLWTVRHLQDATDANGVKTIGILYMDDLFGLENYAALKVAVGGSGLSLVEEKSYPGGVKDLGPVLRGIQAKVAASATPKETVEKLGSKPGASRATLAAGLAGKPVCIAM